MVIAAPEEARMSDEPTPVEPAEHFSINIRIYVYHQGDRWYAASTEYVLMSEGPTEHDAVMAFVDAAVGYLSVALERGWIDALNRRPGLMRRLEIRRRYHVARLLHRGAHTLRKHLEFASRVDLSPA